MEATTSNDSRGPDNWAIPIVIPAAYRKTATVNAVTFAIAFIPSIFVLYCVIRRTELFTKFKTTIMFSWIVQTVFTLPIFFWNAFAAVFAWKDIPTTLGLCTWMKGLTASFYFGSFMSITAVAISRHLSIVWRKEVAVWHLVLLTFLCAIPCFAHPFIYIFFGVLAPNNNCSQINYSPFIIIAQGFFFYIMFVVLVGSVINIATLVYLVYHFKKETRQMPITAAFSIKRNDISRKELAISVSLTLQGLAPVITMGTSAVSTALIFSGVKLGDTTSVVVDTISASTAGVNILCSIVLLRTFRRMFVEIFRPGYYGTAHRINARSFSNLTR